MTNEKMEDIYLYAVKAKNSGQARIPIYVFPNRMDHLNYRTLTDRYQGNASILAFWKNIREGYMMFTRKATILSFSVNLAGTYIFQ